MYLLLAALIVLAIIACDFVCYNYVLTLSCALDVGKCDISDLVLDGLAGQSDPFQTQLIHLLFTWQSMTIFLVQIVLTLIFVYSRPLPDGTHDRLQMFFVVFWIRYSYLVMQAARTETEIRKIYINNQHQFFKNIAHRKRANKQQQQQQQQQQQDYTENFLFSMGQEVAKNGAAIQRRTIDMDDKYGELKSDQNQETIKQMQKRDKYVRYFFYLLVENMVMYTKVMQQYYFNV